MPGYPLPRLRGTLFEGGPGRDGLVISASKRVPIQLDLARGSLVLEHGATTARVSSFEDAELHGSTVDVVGSAKDNVLSVTSCRAATVRGLAGDDELTLVRGEYPSCSHPVRRAAYGDAGDDVLTGSESADRLDGGRGHDTADGLEGRDTCLSVEVRTSCEKRR